MNKPIIFISYSHDNDAHRERVLALSERLRDDGLETCLDRYINGSPAEGWPRWMLDRLDEANFVLVICTETYYRRFRGHEEPGKGKGVDWEGALITNEIYDARSMTLKFVPVLFSPDDQKFIPEPLRGLTHHTLSAEENYQSLYDFLLGQAGIEPGELGALKRKPRPKGQPLTFANEAPTNPPAKVSTHHLPRPLTPHLFGRDEELKLLNEVWAQANINIIVFHAIGGAGKSALVSKWLAKMATENYQGARRIFGWSFFSQGAGENRSDSSEIFIDTMLRWFDEPEAQTSNYFSKAERLAELIRSVRTLLILDGLEPLQYPPNTAGLPEGSLKDRPLQLLLDALAAQQPGLCIVTSRERLNDLNSYEDATVLQRPLDHLPFEAGAQLLRTLGVEGADEELIEAAKEFNGHAYGLTLLGSYLATVMDGDIRRRKEIANLFEDDRFGPSAEKMIAAYETWLGDGVEVAILRMLGLFDRPAEATSIAALRIAPAIPGLTEKVQGMSEVKWQQALAKLRRINLLSEARHDLDAHPLVREYFRQQLKTQLPEVWKMGNLCLYEHLTGTTKEFPDTLAEMQPLFAAVTHGCEAGLYLQAGTVYEQRILRGDEQFHYRRLGAFGAGLAVLNSFFVTPWSEPSTVLPEGAQAFVLHEVGFQLGALGRLREASQATQKALDMRVVHRHWEFAAQSANNLSEMLLMLGDLSQSLTVAKQSVSLADRNGEAGRRMDTRTALADVLHQAGRLADAHINFQEAEAIQRKRGSKFKKLYSFPGFRYCDLLLTQGEYQLALSRSFQMVKWAERNMGLLTNALSQLAFGRAHLAMAVKLDGAKTVTRRIHLSHAENWLYQAMHKLRQAGHQDELTRGLLARAAWALAAQQFDQAHRDLTEARSIAERGEMRLYLCDYHLESARLHLAQGNKDKAREHWTTAREMVAQMGYHRRDKEVEEIAAQLG